MPKKCDFSSHVTQLSHAISWWLIDGFWHGFVAAILEFFRFSIRIRELFWGWQRRNSKLPHKTTNNKSLGTYFAYRESPLQIATFLNDPTVSGVSVGPCLRGRVLPPKSSDLEMEQRQLKKPIERSFLNVDNPTMRGLWHGGGLEKTPESYCSDLGSNQERNFWRLNTTQLKWPHWFDPVRIAGSILFLVWKETGVTWSLGYMFEKTISWHHYMPFDSNWI